MPNACKLGSPRTIMMSSALLWRTLRQFISSCSKTMQSAGRNCPGCPKHVERRGDVALYRRCRPCNTSFFEWIQETQLDDTNISSAVFSAMAPRFRKFSGVCPLRAKSARSINLHSANEHSPSDQLRQCSVLRSISVERHCAPEPELRRTMS